MCEFGAGFVCFATRAVKACFDPAELSGDGRIAFIFFSWSGEYANNNFGKWKLIDCQTTLAEEPDEHGEIRGSNDIKDSN